MFVVMELLVTIIFIIAGIITPTYTSSEDGYGGPGPSARDGQEYAMDSRTLRKE